MNAISTLTSSTPSASVVQRALAIAQSDLAQWLNSDAVNSQLQSIFGDRIDQQQAKTLIQTWIADAYGTTPIEIRSRQELQGALGAFAGATNTIYLSEEFIQEQGDRPDAIASVLLEEFGHALDWQLNTADTPGDEGELFSRLVRGQAIAPTTLETIRHEDDAAIVQIDGATLAIEQARVGDNSAFDLIGLTQLRNDSRFQGIDGSNTSVVVIDTGLDYSHSLLRPNYLTGFDFITNSSNPVDSLGHGTHVAGIIGATDETIGMATDVNLIGLQVFRATGNAYNPDIEKALQWVLNNRERYNIVAVNMSLGGGAYSSPSQVLGDTLTDDVQRLEQAGVTVVAAAGNAFKTYEYKSVSSPAIYSTLAVGAVWQDNSTPNYWWGDGAIDYSTGSDRILSISQRLDSSNMIFAPGALITSTVPGNKLEAYGGTSMASPMVTGAVALMQEAAMQFGGRQLTPDEIVATLRSTADTIYDGDDENDNVRNTNQSYLRLNVYEAVKSIYDQFQGDNGRIDNTSVVVTDPNGTIASAIQGPRMDGATVSPVLSTIGNDGTTQIGGQDVDLVRFEVVSPGVITVETTPHPSQANDFDTLLRLFDQTGQELAFDDNSGTGNFSRISQFLNSGVYYAGVSGLGNRNYNPTIAGSGTVGATGNFALQFSLSQGDPNGVLGGATAVNLGTNREPLLILGELGKDYTSTIATADVDLFKIVAPDDGYLLVDIDTPFTSNYVDTFLRVFDSAGQVLTLGGQSLQNDNALATDITGNALEFTQSGYATEVFSDASNSNTMVGHTSDSFLKLAVERGETYYVGVSGTDHRTYNPTTLNGRPATGATGRYWFKANFSSQDTNGSIDSSTPVLALPTTARRENLGTDRDSITGATQTVGDRDVDFYKVNSPTAGVLEIDLDSFSDASIADRVDACLLIFDNEGNLVGFNDDNFEDSSNSARGFLDPLLRVQIEANKDYFVAIAGYGNNSFDPYAPSSGSAGDMGDYLINSRLLPLSSAPLLTDNSINQGTLQEVQVGSSILGHVGRDTGLMVGAADVDLYRFRPTTSGTVEIRTQSVLSNTSSPSIADTFLRVFNASGTELAYNDDADSTTTGSVLTLSVTAGSTYYIGVNGSSAQARNYNALTGVGAVAGSQGNYRLTLSQNGQTELLDVEDGTNVNDTITATQNNDKVNGREGDDILRGSGGNDVLIGGKGNDRIWGDRGNDILRGTSGDDELQGGSGNDNLGGGSGNDRLVGGSGKDGLKGGSGEDQLLGGGGNDTLKGDRDNDYLLGGNGRDKLVGGTGDDILMGGAQKDVLLGKQGVDSFVLEGGSGTDVFGDFSLNDDRIRLTGSLQFNQLSITQAGNDTLIHSGNETLAIVKGVQANLLTESFFVSL